MPKQFTISSIKVEIEKLRAKGDKLWEEGEELQEKGSVCYMNATNLEQVIKSIEGLEE